MKHTGKSTPPKSPLLRQLIHAEQTPSTKGWGHITEDLKHSADLWTVLEVSPETQSPLAQVRAQIAEVKSLMDEFSF